VVAPPGSADIRAAAQALWDHFVEHGVAYLPDVAAARMSAEPGGATTSAAPRAPS
jgi:hypothetical protein